MNVAPKPFIGRRGHVVSAAMRLSTRLLRGSSGLRESVHCLALPGVEGVGVRGQQNIGRVPRHGNAFEIWGAMHRLSREVLGGQKQLIMSSEWDFSPYVDEKALKDFVFIGSPATESSSAFLIPLAGHELGHPLWADLRLDIELDEIHLDKILSWIRDDHWPEYQELYPGAKPGELENLINRKNWSSAVDWSVSQAAETFCDFVRLWLFGKSYLYAFASLLSPQGVSISAGASSLLVRIGGGRAWIRAYRPGALQLDRARLTSRQDVAS